MIKEITFTNNTNYLFIANKEILCFFCNYFPQHTSTQYARCVRISTQYRACIDFVFNIYLTLFKIAMHMEVFLNTFDM